MDYPDTVRLSQLIERRVAKARTEESTAEQDDRVAFGVSKIRVGYAVRFIPAGLRICGKHKTPVEPAVANEFERSHGDKDWEL